MAEPLRRKIASGAVWGGLNLVLAACVTLVTTPLYLGLLKESGYGINGVFQAVFAVLNLLSLGAQEATLYFAARDQSEAYVRVLARWHFSAACIGAALLSLSWAWGLGSRLGLKGAELEQFQAVLLPAAALWGFQFFCQWLWLLCRARLRLTLQGHAPGPPGPGVSACGRTAGPAFYRGPLRFFVGPGPGLGPGLPEPRAPPAQGRAFARAPGTGSVRRRGMDAGDRVFALDPAFFLELRGPAVGRPLLCGALGCGGGGGLYHRLGRLYARGLGPGPPAHAAHAGCQPPFGGQRA